MSEFKDIFYELRKENNYSQLEIAKMLKVSKSTVSMWELGNRIPQRITMEAISDIFNLDMDYLYGKTEVKRRVSFDNKGNASVYVPDFDPDIMEIIDLLSKITPEQKQAVLSMLRSFATS